MHDDDMFDDDDDEFDVRVWSSENYHPWADAVMDFLRGAVFGAGFVMGGSLMVLLVLLFRAAFMFLA